MVSTGSVSVTAEAIRRRPKDPVSTWILVMVWHCVVLPRTHTVTVVKSVLMSAPWAVSGPGPTSTASTLAAPGGGGGGGVPPPDGAAGPPPPPPQAVKAAIVVRPAMRRIFDKARISLHLRVRRPRVRRRAGRRGRRSCLACGRSTAPPNYRAESVHGGDRRASPARRRRIDRNTLPASAANWASRVRSRRGQTHCRPRTRIPAASCRRAIEYH